MRRAGFDSTAVTSKVAASSAALKAFASSSVPDVEARDLAAVGADEPRLEALALVRFQSRNDRPILTRHEALDLHLAIADEPERDGLHAAGGAGARQLAPEHGREVEADEIIERAAGQISIDQRLIDGPGRAHRLVDGPAW